MITARFEFIPYLSKILHCDIQLVATATRRPCKRVAWAPASAKALSRLPPYASRKGVSVRSLPYNMSIVQVDDTSPTLFWYDGWKLESDDNSFNRYA